MALILAVDDEPLLVKSILEAEGHTVFTADDGKAGVQLDLKYQADLVITDFHMPEMEGVELTIKARKLKPALKIIGMTRGAY